MLPVTTDECRTASFETNNSKLISRLRLMIICLHLRFWSHQVHVYKTDTSHISTVVICIASDALRKCDTSSSDAARAETRCKGHCCSISRKVAASVRRICGYKMINTATYAQCTPPVADADVKKVSNFVASAV